MGSLAARPPEVPGSPAPPRRPAASARNCVEMHKNKLVFFTNNEIHEVLLEFIIKYSMKSRAVNMKPVTANFLELSLEFSNF